MLKSVWVLKSEGCLKTGAYGNVLVDVHGGSGDKTNLVHDLGYINIHACPCWEFPVQPNVTVAGERWIPQYNGSQRSFIVTWPQKIHFSLLICQ